jgi:hypothetical protein
MKQLIRCLVAVLALIPFGCERAKTTGTDSGHPQGQRSPPENRTITFQSLDSDYRGTSDIRPDGSVS